VRSKERKLRVCVRVVTIAADAASAGTLEQKHTGGGDAAFTGGKGPYGMGHECKLGAGADVPAVGGGWVGRKYIRVGS
jgi:hypothetical protein